MKRLILAAAMVSGLALPACPAMYPAELALCNQTAKTLCESIECENKAREAKGRPLREMPASCVDGGKDASHE